MNRWAILGGYALLSACTQMLWLTYAPLSVESAAALHTGVAHIGWLSAVFQLLFIALSVPAGRALDRHFGAALGGGAALTALGALLRVIGPDAFGWQLAGQLVIAVAQPLILNAVTEVADRYFPPHERTVVVSVGTASLFLGILIAMLTGPLLYAHGGLPAVLVSQLTLTAIAAVWVGVAARTPSPHPARRTRPFTAPSGLYRDPLLWRLGILLFLGYGAFISLSTWLEAILSGFGIGSVQSGILTGLMILAGMIGSALLPPLVVARNLSRRMILTSLALGVLALSAVAWHHGLAWVGVWLVVCGLFTMSTLPVLLHLAEQHVGEGVQGAAVGFLLLLSNAGGLVLVLIVQPLVGVTAWPLPILIGALALAAPVAYRLPGQTAHPARV